MQITTEFDLGVTVFYVASRPVIVPCACTACGATGHVTLLDGNQYQCPKCRAMTTQTGQQEQYVVSGAVLRILPTAAPAPAGTLIRYEVSRDPAKPIMLNEDDVYSSQAEAQASITP